jgi:hypothetical protein
LQLGAIGLGVFLVLWALAWQRSPASAFLSAEFFGAALALGAFLAAAALYGIISPLACRGQKDDHLKIYYVLTLLAILFFIAFTVRAPCARARAQRGRRGAIPSARAARRAAAARPAAAPPPRAPPLRRRRRAPSPPAQILAMLNAHDTNNISAMLDYGWQMVSAVARRAAGCVAVEASLTRARPARRLAAGV